MNKKFILVAILIIVIAIGCEKEENTTFDVNVGMRISYIDSQKQDLLDPNISNSYNTDEFKIYHYKNGEKVLFSMSNLDYPKGYYVFKEADMQYYMLTITEPNFYNEAKSIEEYEAITFLELSSNETDTIKCVIRTSDNSYDCRKVYYNNNLVWAWEDGIARQFTIEK